MIKDLKQYRPHRKPITDIPTHLENHPRIKRKRRLIVRDWFRIVIWYNRLKKVIREFYT